GQKQLELGLALALEPEILLLDEPTAGMSATETREAIRLIERIARERGLTLLFTEHDVEVVCSISERITVVHQGRVIANGPPDEPPSRADRPVTHERSASPRRRPRHRIRPGRAPAHHESRRVGDPRRRPAPYASGRLHDRAGVRAVSRPAPAARSAPGLPHRRR